MKRFFASLIALLAVASVASGPAVAADPQKLVEDSAALAKSLLADPEWADYQALFTAAKAVILTPDFLKAGFVIGGAGGQCVMIARNPTTGEWSSPSFCMIGEASIGFQIGASTAEVMMLVMTDGAVDKLVNGTAKLGGEAGIAFGAFGSGIKGNTTFNLDRDIYAFSRNRGLFGGVAIEGGWIGPDTEYNHAYYGEPVTARNILIDGTARNQDAELLIRAALQQMN